MDASITKEWLEFPLAVFIDTQVFIKESYDFSTKGKFALFEKQVSNGKAQLLTSDIVKGEVVRHIKEDVNKGLEKLQSTLSDRRLAIFREGSYSEIFGEIDISAMTVSALKTFNDYLTKTGAILLDIEDVDLRSVVTDYFSAKPPFGEGHKKSEFPDAFNVSMLQKHSTQYGKIYVVSNDGDFSNVENVYCFKTLNELLDAINSQDKISSQSKNYVISEAVLKHIYNQVENTLIDIGCELDVDGTDTDRKGVSSGYEYDEIELLSVSQQRLTELEVVDIDYSDNTITIMTNCKLKLEFSCSFFDEENSMWDSEDKEYAHAYHGTMHEFHNALIPVEIHVAFDNDNEDISFDIDEIIVDTNIRFDQYTLQKDGRSRTDNPNSYWEDDDDNFENYCPDCGCGMTFENDGGNGFCIKCAPEH